MIKDQCTVCEYGPERLDWTLSKTEIARQIGCHRASVSRHIKHSENPELSVETGGTGGTGEPEGNWVPRRKWQSASGEWMYSYQNVSDPASVLETVDNDRIDRLVGQIREPDFPDVTTGPTEVLIVADPQIGKAGEAGGGTPETIERIHSGVSSAIQRYMLNPPKELYLVDLGDAVENLFSVGVQLTSNDRTLPEQVEDYVAMSMDVIGRLLGYVGKLVHVTVTSNHGQARNAIGNNPYGSENDWGLMMQRLIKGKCLDRGWDVEFIRPELNEDTSVVKTGGGSRLAFTHGHHSGSPAKMKAWVTGQIVGRRPGWDADTWFFGHYHNDTHFTVGNGVAVFGTPAIDPGSAWFTRKTGEACPAGLMALTVCAGKWSNHSILS